jgi:hypothetical protein
MTIKMADGGEKAIDTTPTYIITAPSTTEARESGSGKIQKKHVLIGVSLVVVAGLVLAAILIGMHMFAESQKDIVKFSMNFKSNSDGSDMKQDVEADPNDNVVTFRVSKNGQDVTIVNDFNRDMQVVKLETASDTNCYVTPLNRSDAMDPSQMNDLQTNNGVKNRKQELFTISNSPVIDRSFLPKKAADMCKGVSVYWAYRSCQGLPIEQPDQTPSDDRSRRTVYNAPSYNGLACLNGCCYTYCACAVYITESCDATACHCNYYVQTNTCCVGQTGGTVAAPYCQNWYYARQATPGLVCPP